MSNSRRPQQSAHPERMIKIETITIKALDVRTVARFWRDFLGYRVAPNHSDSALLVGSGPALLIQPSQARPLDAAIHLDLRPEDPAVEIRRALDLGASLADIGQSGAEGWTVLRDPGGNLFCILEGVKAFDAHRVAEPGQVTPID